MKLNDIPRVCTSVENAHRAATHRPIAHRHIAGPVALVARGSLLLEREEYHAVAHRNNSRSSGRDTIPTPLVHSDNAMRFGLC